MFSMDFIGQIIWPMVFEGVSLNSIQFIWVFHVLRPAPSVHHVDDHAFVNFFEGKHSQRNLIKKPLFAFTYLIGNDTSLSVSI